MPENELTLRVPGDPGQNNTYVGVGQGGVYNYNPNAETVNNNTFHYVPIKPMFITKIINKLSDPSFPEVTENDIDFKRYKIHEKEDFNHLKRWKTDIKLYAPYRPRVNEIYQGFEAVGKNKRETVYRWLHREYARLHDELEADALFDALKKYVSEKVNQDVDLFDNISFEEMEENVCIVLVDAFIECRIFEKPV